MKHFFSLIGLMICFCSFAFANGQQETKTTPAVDQGPVTVTILTTATTQNPEGPLAKEYIADFMKQNPNITIEVSDVPNNQALTKVTTLAAAGSLPDLFVNTENYIGKYVDMGICGDMTPYLSDSELSNINDAVREYCTFDGKLLMYPWYSGPNALIYRADWLKEAGIEPPTTLDEMLEAAKKLTNEEHYGFGMIGTNDDSGQTRFVMILRSFGARELYKDGNEWKTEIGSPESVAAFKYFAGLKNDAKVVPPGALENSFNENVNLLATGKIGMVIAGSNSVGKIFTANPDLKGKIASVQMPSGKTTYTPISILGWSLNPDSKHKAEAMKFAKFMSEKQNAIRWVEVTGRMPCTKDAVAESNYLNTNLFKGFVAGSKAMETVPNAPFYSEVKSVLGRTYQKLMLDSSLDVEKEVQAAGKEIQKIINDNK